MAFRRFPRRSFSNRRSRPLRRWTADTFQDQQTAVVSSAGTFFTSQSIQVITPDTYRQNSELEPDGATLLRVVATLTYQTFVIDNTNSALEPFTWRLNGVWYVADDNVVGQFPTQMLIDTRVIHFSQRAGSIPRDSTVVPGITRIEAPIGLTGSGSHWPQIDYDFNVKARLRQQDGLWFTAFWGFANPGPEAVEADFSLDLVARALVGGRF